MIRRGKNLETGTLGKQSQTGGEGRGDRDTRARSFEVLNVENIGLCH